ncbi:uncharacterized protein PODANS_3_11300 [Podospora anserina S mat+]|uniref:Podospora anserina S mat+ genomic DNA chromosome 3, supercontig 3 n=1 Tax=Podospora anserina (strain S / ATCC MYA-4624 / DSM 980 / FGSC 10383) TaxID=515849 RepID=B2ACV7_PODAN|nr:uncharacterized protein PODANS_3_11300 [Podospora anserina S mat+]CAP61272.1 unnamed protein product [Podospora anserina S mat+]
MIPPIDDLVLQQNPEFAALYTTLTTVILNPDASTRKDPKAKKRAAELDTHRLKTAKHHLLINAISTAHPTTEQPPPPAQEKPSLLRHRSTRSRSESQPLKPSGPLPPPLPLAQPKPPPLLHSLLNLSLPAFTLTQLETLHHKKYSLLRSRLSLAVSVSSLLDQQILILSKLIRSLEAKHGPISRWLEYSASERALVAQKQELEIKSVGRALKKEVYSPEVATALGNYSRHLRDAKSRLGERIKGLEGELGEYHHQDASTEREKTRKMREMARVYADMGRQLDEVRKDLERLDTA